jgi:hypothetical protein
LSFNHSGEFTFSVVLMAPISVIASAGSRLQADVMLIRLRRACVGCQQISAFFPRRLMPNAVACWLRINHNLAAYIGRNAIMQAGGLCSEFSFASNAHAMIDSLAGAGVDRSSAGALVEKLEQGHILLGVLAASDDEISIAWHIFNHVCAELIVVGAPSPRKKVAPTVKEEAWFHFPPPMPPMRESAVIAETVHAA